MVVTLNNLSPVEGATKKPKKRLGRGQGSGKGGTSTRGHKGAKSRSGYSKKIGFEGGQMPLQRRIPKFGFKNVNRKEYAGINLDVLCALVEHKKVQDKIDPATLKSNGIVSSTHKRIKILARGGEALELKGIKIYAHKFSKKSKEIIEKAGGEAINLIKSSKE